MVGYGDARSDDALNPGADREFLADLLQPFFKQVLVCPRVGHDLLAHGELLIELHVDRECPRHTCLVYDDGDQARRARAR